MQTFGAGGIYWSFQAPNFAEIKEVVDAAEGPDAGFGWQPNCVVRTLEAPQLLPLLVPTLELWGKALPTAGSLAPNGPVWINRYQRGGFQEIHNHNMGDTDVSMVLFMNHGPDFSEFCFFNPNSLHNTLPYKWQELLPENQKEKWVPTVKPGTVLIFPATAYHFVTAHRSDEERVTVAANFLMNVNV